MTARVLVSYHLHKHADLNDLVTRFPGGVDLFADSGAFSAHTTGAEVRLADYLAWLSGWAGLFTTVANLDVIGDHQATRINQAKMEEAGWPALPVFHVNEPWSALEALLPDHGYIALGGLARHAPGGHKHQEMMAWLVQAFKLAAKTGAAFHAFGITSATILRDLPFYSVDSSSYLYGPKWGLSYLWDGPKLKMRSLHYRNPGQLSRVRALMRSHGLSPARVIRPDFLSEESPNRARDRMDLLACSATAYRFMEASLTARHQVQAPYLPVHAVPGTKVYLAASSSPADWQALANAEKFASQGGPWCFCCARYGLAVTATGWKAGGTVCDACAGRSPSACERTHVAEALKAAR